MESLESHVSIYGRIADSLTRAVISKREFKVMLIDYPKEPVYKTDGYFVFSDIFPSSLEYEFLVQGDKYDQRLLRSKISPGDPSVSLEVLELNYPGEDELYVYATHVNNGQKKVSFTTQPFIPTIQAGSLVIGQDGFTGVLAETLEGCDKDFAILRSVAELNNETFLRLVRSHSITLQPNPYYSFPSDTTIVSLKIRTDSLGQSVIPDARLEILEVNDMPLLTSDVGDLTLKSVRLDGTPKSTLVLGTEKDITRISNRNGAAVFYFPSKTLVEKLLIRINRNGYLPIDREISVTAGARHYEELILQAI